MVSHHRESLFFWAYLAEKVLLIIFLTLGKKESADIITISKSNPLVDRDGIDTAGNKLDQMVEPHLPVPHTNTSCAAAGNGQQASTINEKKNLISTVPLFILCLL